MRKEFLMPIFFMEHQDQGRKRLALEFAKEISSTDSEKFISSDNIFFIIPAKKDFYEKLFKSKSFDSEEYKKWKTVSK